MWEKIPFLLQANQKPVKDRKMQDEIPKLISLQPNSSYNLNILPKQPPNVSIFKTHQAMNLLIGDQIVKVA